MRFRFQKIICILNNAIINKKQYVKINFTRDSLSFIQLLYQENYLDFYSIYKKDIIFIKFKSIRGETIIKKLFVFNKKGQYQNIKLSSVWSSSFLNLGQAIFLTSSNRYITDKIIKKGFSGGSFLCFIIL